MSGVLTRRQMEILLLIAAGKTLPEMAADLYLSEHTVKTHRKTLFAVLGAKNAASAVACAYQRGILRAPERRGERSPELHPQPCSCERCEAVKHPRDCAQCAEKSRGVTGG